MAYLLQDHGFVVVSWSYVSINIDLYRLYELHVFVFMMLRLYMLSIVLDLATDEF
jgi:hypothetical protein